MLHNKNPHEQNGRFYFDEHHHPESLLFGTLPSFISSLFFRIKNRVPEHFVEKWTEKTKPLEYSIPMNITWLGHATFLIQANGFNILTDPIFGSPSVFYPRVLPLGIPVDSLPPIDIVLISHNHRDHLDQKSIQALYAKNKRTKFFVPFGDRPWFTACGIKGVTEFIWGQEVNLSHYDGFGDIRFVFMPTLHWSARGLFDKNKSLWGSWIVQTASNTLYFAGDTAFSADCFTTVADRFKRIDIALLPIAPQEPRTWMQHTHLDAQQALEAFKLLQAKALVPMHWGTFRFGNDQIEAPIEHLTAAWNESYNDQSDYSLLPMKVGERRLIPTQVF